MSDKNPTGPFNPIKNIEGIEPATEATLGANATLETTVEAGNIDLKGKVTYTVEEPVTKKSLPDLEQRITTAIDPRIEQQLAYLKSFAQSASQVIRPGSNSQGKPFPTAHIASAGFSTVNEAIDKTTSLDAYKAELEAALKTGRASSGSATVQLEAAKIKRKALTLDVENTFSRDNGKEEIVSASYDSGDGVTTLVRKDYKTLLTKQIRHLKEKQDLNAAKLMESVLDSLNTAVAETIPDSKGNVKNPNLKLVTQKGMSQGLVAAINADQTMPIEGVRVHTDADKIANLIPSTGRENRLAREALVGNSVKGIKPRIHNIEDDFRAHFNLPNEFTKGQSLTHMLDLVGLLPASGAEGAHGSGWDVTKSRELSNVLRTLTSYEQKYGENKNTEVPDVVAALKKRLTDPSVREGYLSRVMTSSALNQTGKIQSGQLFTNAEEAAQEARNLVTEFSQTKQGTLKDLTDPTTTVHSTGLTEDQKAEIAANEYGVPYIGNKKSVIAETRKTVKEGELAKLLHPVTTESLDDISMRYALQATHNLQNKSYATSGNISEEAINAEIKKVTAGLKADFGGNLRTADGSGVIEMGLNTGIEQSLKNFKPTILHKEKPTSNIGYTMSNAVTLASELQAKIRAALPTAGVAGLTAPLFIDKQQSPYLTETAFNIPITQSELATKAVQPSNENEKNRALGLKNVSSYAYKNLTRRVATKVNDPSNKSVELNPDAKLESIVDGIREAQRTGSFKPELDEYLTTTEGPERNRNIAASLNELFSQKNMAQGNKFEQSEKIGQLLSNQGYTAVKPTKKGKGSQYEHEGNVAGLEGHPDLLAYRPEKKGNQWERRYLLADIKSPVIPTKEGDTVSSMISTAGRGEWLAQVLAYARLLPEKIRKNLDIGVITGGDNQTTSLIKDSYDNILKETSKNPASKPIVEALGTVFDSIGMNKEGELTTLPKNIPTPGVLPFNKFSSSEQNYIKSVQNESGLSTTAYSKEIEALAKKRQGKTDTELVSEYAAPITVTGAGKSTTLKSKLDTLEKLHNKPNGVFGKLPTDEFNAISLTLLSKVTSAPKSEQRTALEEALTGPPLKALDSVKAHFEQQNLVIQEAQTKADTVVKERIGNLKNYSFNLGTGGASFFRGAFVQEGVRGHKGENKDLVSLTGDWQTKPAVMPGALSYEDAERRARLEKYYLTQYNRADLGAQLLIHRGEAKLAAEGTGEGDTNLLHTFMKPSALTAAESKALGTDQYKDVPFRKRDTETYKVNLEERLQERAYYRTQLDTVRDSASSFDIRKKLHQREESKRVSDSADELDRALKLQDSIAGSTGVDQGKATHGYERSYNRLQKLGLGEEQLQQMGLAKPIVFDPNTPNTPFAQGYLQAKDAYSAGKFLTTTTGISSEEQESISKRIQRADLSARINTSSADFIESTTDSPEKFKLAAKKRQEAENNRIEAESLRTFLEENKVRETPAIISPESALNNVKGNRKDLLEKHINNALLAQTEASNFALTPEILKSLSSSVSAIHSLGGSAAEHGIDVSTLLKSPIQGFTPSAQLAKLSYAENTVGQTDLSGQVNILNAQHNYAKSLKDELQNLVTGENPFAAFGKSIEEDILKIKVMKDELATLTVGSDTHTKLQSDINTKISAVTNDIAEFTEFNAKATPLQVVDSRRDTSLKQHVQTALEAQAQVNAYGLTPELQTTLHGSVSAIHALGGNATAHGIDLATMFNNATLKDFKGSAALQSADHTANNVTSYTSRLAAVQQQEAYIKQLEREFRSLDTIVVDTPFKQLGIAIETDKKNLETLIIASKSLTGDPVPLAENLNEQSIIRSRIEANISDLRQRKTIESSTVGGDIYTQEARDGYVRYKDLRQAKASDASNFLAAALELGDFSPELLRSINRQKRENETLGIDHAGLASDQVFQYYEAYLSDPTKRRQAIVNTDLSNNAIRFTSASQVIGNYNANKAQVGSSDINVFDAIHAKEQSALKVVNELRTALIEVGGTSLDKLEKEFIDLYKDIQLSVNELKELEAQNSKAPANIKAIADKRISIEQSIGSLDTKRQEIVKNRPTLDTHAWNAMKTQAATAASIDEYDLIKKAMTANAKIESLGERASYNDYMTAHTTAKELKQRNISIDGNIGLKSEKDIEQLATQNKKPYFQGQSHVSFTEQLVDLANWQVQWAGATAITQGFTAALYGGFGAAREFEASMREVELISQASSVQIDSLKEKVVELGSSFKVPVKELADGLVVLGQAGYKAAESVNMIQPISQLAVATGATHKEASDITTSVMMTYNQPVSSAADITNTLAAATIESKLELGALGTTFNYIGATASLAGLSLEETATAMGLMSNAGVKASTIGTSLRSIVGALIAPTANFRAELGRVGLSIDELNPLANDLGTVLGKLSSKGFSVENAFQGMNKREAGAMAVLLNQSSNWGDFKSRITGTDRAETMAEGQMDTYDAQVARMHNNIKIAGIKTFEGSMGPLKEMAKGVSGGFSLIADIADTSMGKTTAAIMSTMLAATTATTIIGTLGKATKLIAPAALSGLGQAWGFKTPGITLPEEGRRLKIHEGVASLTGLGFNPWLLGAAGLITAGTFAYGAYKRQATGRGKLEEATYQSDYMNNLQQTLDTAAKQQKHLKLFDKGFTSEKQSYLRDLTSSSMFVGYDIDNAVVNPYEVKEHRARQARGLYIDSSDMDLKNVSAGLAMYKETFNTPKALKAKIFTGNKEYEKRNKLFSDEGKNYVQTTSDLIGESLKEKGIYYNKEKSLAFLNEHLSDSDFDKSVRQNVIDKQDVALRAPDRPEMERSMAERAFKTSILRARTISDILAGNRTKATTELEFGSDQGFILEELRRDKVEKALNDNPHIAKPILEQRGRFEKEIDPVKRAVERDTLLALLEKTATYAAPGLNQLGGISVRMKEHRSDLYNEDTKKAAYEDAKAAQETSLRLDPTKVRSKGEYSHAKVLFSEDIAESVDKYTGVQDKLKSVIKELNAEEASGGKGSSKWKNLSLEAEAYKAELEDLNGELKRLEQASFSYLIGSIDDKLRPMAKDLRNPSKFAEKDLKQTGDALMLHMPGIVIPEFRTQAVTIQEKYQKLLSEEFIKRNPTLVKTVNIAWELEEQKSQEELITKTTAKVKELSDRLTVLLGRGLTNKTVGIQLDADLKTLNIDKDLANKKAAAVLSPRDIVERAGTNRVGSTWYSGQLQTMPYKTNTALIDISKFSADDFDMQTIDANMAKNKANEERALSTYNAETKNLEDVRTLGIETAYRTTGQGHAPVEAQLPQPITPAEVVARNFKKTVVNGIATYTNVQDKEAEVGKDKPEFTKLALLAVEEKYQEGRIAASSKAFQSIRKNIEDEMRMRDRLLDKMKSLGDFRKEATRSLDDTMKELGKAAGMDMRRKPSSIAKDYDALILKAKEYKETDNVEGAKEVVAAAKSLGSELITNQEAGYHYRSAMDKTAEINAIVQATITGREEKTRSKIEKLDSSINNEARVQVWAEGIRGAIKKDTSITEAEKTIRISQFDKNFEAVKGDPTGLRDLVEKSNNVPGFAGEHSAEESLKNLTDISTKLADAFTDLYSKMTKGKDVTPKEEDLKTIIGSEAYNLMGLGSVSKDKLKTKMVDELPFNAQGMADESGISIFKGTDDKRKEAIHEAYHIMVREKGIKFKMPYAVTAGEPVPGSREDVRAKVLEEAANAAFTGSLTGQTDEDFKAQFGVSRNTDFQRVDNKTLENIMSSRQGRRYARIYEGSIKDKRFDLIDTPNSDYTLQPLSPRQKEVDKTALGIKNISEEVGSFTAPWDNKEENIRIAVNRYKDAKTRFTANKYKGISGNYERLSDKSIIHRAELSSEERKKEDSEVLMSMIPIGGTTKVLRAATNTSKFTSAFSSGTKYTPTIEEIASYAPRIAEQAISKSSLGVKTLVGSIAGLGLFAGTKSKTKSTSMPSINQDNEFINNLLTASTEVSTPYTSRLIPKDKSKINFAEASRKSIEQGTAEILASMPKLEESKMPKVETMKEFVTKQDKMPIAKDFSLEQLKAVAVEQQKPFDIWNKSTGIGDFRKKAKKAKLSSEEIERVIAWGKKETSHGEFGGNVGTPASIKKLQPDNTIGSNRASIDGIIAGNISAAPVTPLLSDSAAKPSLNLSLGEKGDKAFRALLHRPNQSDQLISEEPKQFIRSITQEEKSNISKEYPGVTPFEYYKGKTATDLVKATSPTARYDLGEAPTAVDRLTTQTTMAPSSATDTLLESNNKLTLALDNLRTTIDKMSTPAATQTASGSQTPVSVTVTAPITVPSTSATAQDVSAVATKVCTEFFNNEFVPRYIQAVNTVGV